MLVVLPLASCGPGGEKLSPWDEAGILQRGWAYPREVPVEPSYCYNTIGRVDCYVVPQTGAARRRSGYPNLGDPQAVVSP